MIHMIPTLRTRLRLALALLRGRPVLHNVSVENGTISAPSTIRVGGGVRLVNNYIDVGEGNCFKVAEENPCQP